MRLSVKYILTLLISIVIINVQSQQVYRFTLKQAVDFAMENNYDVIYSERNIEAAKQQMREATAIGLPQLDGAMDYTKNIQRPVSVIPSEDFPGGQPGDVLDTVWNQA